MRRYLPIFVSCILIPCLAQLLFAQESNVSFLHITVADGLSQDIVKTILQDGRGFMWFGTEDGLNRYDGYSIKVYKHNPRDTASLSNNDIHAIYEDSHQRLWIGTSIGLNRYDHEKESFVHFIHDSTNSGSLCRGGILSIREDGHGSLWIATTEGLNRYDESTGTFLHFFHRPLDSNSVNADRINFILLDRSGVLWFATANGFCRFDEPGKRFVRYLFSVSSRSKANIVWLHEDRSGTIWASQTEHGIWCLDAARRGLRAVPLSPHPGHSVPSDVLADAVVTSIGEDAKGSVWIGHFRGLDVFDPLTRKFSHFLFDQTDPTALGGRVEVVYRDRVGMMWLGTFQSGVYRYDPNRQRFQLFTKNASSRNALSSNYVLSVLEDNSGAVWVGSDRGLDRLVRTGSVVAHYRHNPHDPTSINSDQVNAILQDKSGVLWVGGVGGTTSNLDRIDKKNNQFEHFPFMSVRSLFEDRDGELWVGLADENNTGENLIRLDRQRKVVTRYSAPGTGVWCIYQDRDGYLWTGGQYNYLNRFDKRSNSFVRLRTSLNDTTILSSDAVRTIFQDEAGNMWFGTWGAGVYKFNKQENRYTSFLEQDGLPSNYVKAILPDDHGNLWVATEKGLSRLAPATRIFRNFTTEDGLQGDRFLSGSCFRTPDGRMYFGGTNGLNVFHPDSVRDNPNIPPVRITNFKIFDREATLPPMSASAKAIQLLYDQDFFSFEFVALDYTAPHKNQYAYMLEGFDKDWVVAGTRRYAAYTGVKPGKYIFRVRGSNNDGAWNNEGAAVRIIIAPPFWGTWWFTLLATLVVVAALYSIYRYRLSQVLAIERFRIRIAGDLHDDVGTDLSSIVLATQSIERKIPLTLNQRDELRQIGSIATRTQEMMRDIVWVLNSRNDTIDDLILKMREAALRMLGSIPHSFKAPETPLPEKMRLEFKRTIFLFYKECLNNIIKHSSATEVGIAVQSQSRGFVLSISDNGKGFHPESHTTGLGLKSLRTRADQIGADLDISSEPGRGTSITLKVKTT